jgi:hypothetical protein
MRRVLPLVSTVVLFSLTMVVTTAIVRPSANRAEAGVLCNGPRQTVARHGNWAAIVQLCVEVSTGSSRPGVHVWCQTATTQVACNWDFDPLHLHDQHGFFLFGERTLGTGKTNGAYIATPHWIDCPSGDQRYSDTPNMRVRWPDDTRSPYVSATWQGTTYVTC